MPSATCWLMRLSSTSRMLAADPGRRRWSPARHTAGARDRLLRLAGHHVDQAFVQHRLAHRLDEAGVDARVARVPDIRLAAGQHDQPHLGDVGARPDRCARARARPCPAAPRSMIAMSYGALRAAACASSSIACSGVSATRLVMPQLLICAWRMPRLMALDSTISARTPVSMPIGTARGLCLRCASCFSKLRGEPERGAGAERGLDVDRRRPSFPRAAC